MNMSAPSLDVDDVIRAVFKQKRNKAAGPDGIYMESYIFGGHRLHVLLCLAFNIFMKFGYLPSSFCLSTIMPLIKNKSDDSADLNNYRAIAISNSATKIIELVLAVIIETVDNADLYQFGFRKGLSTGLCTNVLKSIVNYYRQQGAVCSAVLLISQKRLIRLIIGCCFIRCWIVLKRLFTILQLGCFASGIVTN